MTSDRNMKEAFSFVSAREVLDKVVEMPVTTWRFKGENDSIRHIGPMAQDFAAAFGYGVDDTHITTKRGLRGDSAVFEEVMVEQVSC